MKNNDAFPFWLVNIFDNSTMDLFWPNVVSCQIEKRRKTVFILVDNYIYVQFLSLLTTQFFNFSTQMSKIRQATINNAIFNTLQKNFEDFDMSNGCGMIESPMDRNTDAVTDLIRGLEILVRWGLTHMLKITYSKSDSFQQKLFRSKKNHTFWSHSKKCMMHQRKYRK